jgi:hypothetical protein
VSPYRTAPVVAPQKAPRASWWRRLMHRDVTRRLDIRRRRHALRARCPWGLWRECHECVLAGQDHDPLMVLSLRVGALQHALSLQIRALGMMREMMPGTPASGTLPRCS